MRRSALFLVLFLVPLFSTIAQRRESFDLATYAVPSGWTKVTDAADVVSYAVTDTRSGTYCQIGIYKSTGSKGSVRSDFQSEWEDLIVRTYRPTTPPASVPAVSRSGWDAQGGAAPFSFGGGQSVAMLVTMSGYATSMSIVILTNTEIYKSDIESFLESVELKQPDSGRDIAASTLSALPPPTGAPPVGAGFAFTTTSFDDGWTSTAREDWVEVSKGGIKVLIHYPNRQADEYNSVLRDGLQRAWNILVAPRYRNIRGLQLRPITGWQSIEYAEADAVEALTGRAVHVVLFRYNYTNGTGRYMEFVTRDQASFEQEFGAYHEATTGWDRMEKMAYYNRFAVAATDLRGRWTNDFSGALQYVNAYTGADAGMATHASSQGFEFGPGNSYRWDLSVADGEVGNMKFRSVGSSGTFSMPNNWQIVFSDIEGKPRTYSVSFSCVKASRILWLDETGYGRLQQ